jgi:hypothetical protein
VGRLWAASGKRAYLANTCVIDDEPAAASGQPALLLRLDGGGLSLCRQAPFEQHQQLLGDNPCGQKLEVTLKILDRDNSLLALYPIDGPRVIVKRLQERLDSGGQRAGRRSLTRYSFGG